MGPMPRALLASLLLAAVSCSGPEAPARIPLLGPGSPPGQLTGEASQLAEPGPGDWQRVHQEIAPGDWFPGPWPGVWIARLAFAGLGTAPERTLPNELAQEGLELPPASISSDFAGPEDLEDGSFYVVGCELFLLDREERYRTQPLDYYAWFERNPLAPRTSLPGTTADGLALLAGETFTVELPESNRGPRELVFGTRLHGSPELVGPSQLVVALDDEPLVSEELTPSLLGAPQAHRITLPAHGSRLSFHVEAGRGICLITNPTVVRSESAPTDPRPDIVIFLADTFRADNLAAWGGDPGLAPHMNRFADEGLVFTGARAAASWTLPSQSSLLTSVYPYQHGATRTDLALPSGLATLPERLQAAGYRTAAVTDGIYVTARHGLDRGFELFLDEPLEGDFDRDTLERVRTVLELDDDRPLFLYVQSYRAHTPYRVTDETFDSHPELFGSSPERSAWDYETEYKKLGALAGEALGRDPAAVAAVRKQAARVEKLYRGGAADLDRGFGRLLELFTPDTLIVLTSDHGESFLEHEALAHGTSVNEEETRVPLVFRGPEIKPGVVADPVTQLDLAPTILALVDVAPPGTWLGRSLFDLDAASAPPVLSYMAGMNPLTPERRFALYEGPKKAIGWIRDDALLDKPPTGFDLATDPGEDHEVTAQGATWPAELMDSHRDELDALMIPLANPEALTLTDEERAHLAAMGYLGE